MHTRKSLWVMLSLLAVMAACRQSPPQPEAKPHTAGPTTTVTVFVPEMGERLNLL
jgi:hypothetical protein